MTTSSSRIAADIVVVGAGLAGLTAANCAAEAGLSVVVLERSPDDVYPCNTRYSGGLFHIAMDDLLAPSETVRANLMRATGGEADPALAEALIGNAARAIKKLKSYGVRFIVAGPDGIRRNSLAPPIVRQPGLNWRGRAGDVMLRTLADALARGHGRIERGVEASELLMEEGRCVGVVASASGAVREYLARAVVLADGGFQANPDLVRRYISPVPDALLQRNACSGRGSALSMAERVGAALLGLDRFYGHVQHRDAMHNDQLWPYPVLDPLATAGIVVDGNARRFCDEGRGGIDIANAIARLPDPLATTVIIDQAIWDGPGRDGLLAVNPHIVRAGGAVLSDTTLSGLAGKLGLPADALRATVDAHNRAAEGCAVEGAQLRTFGSAKAWPIRQGPFHGIPACAGITYTMGGIAIDGNARVRNRDGGVIAGLFAAGACTGGLEGGGHTGYSGGLSKSAVFGMLAGEAAAAPISA